MTIYPAIDIKDERCVRLRMGEFGEATQYGDPVKAAVKWQSLGAKALHVVDLDAALTGTFKNRGSVASIIKAVKIPVQLGGGVRTMSDIEERLAGLGVWRVVIGTAAAEDPEFVSRAAMKYPGRVAAGIDARNGRASIRGWTADAGKSAVELALEMKRRGITTVIYTDISRDGMQSGPDTEGIREMVKKTGLEIIASGGITSVNDIKDAMAAGARGAIIGKALYSGSMSLTEALLAAEGKC